jgi:hypothetical protein
VCHDATNSGQWLPRTHSEPGDVVILSVIPLQEPGYNPTLDVGPQSYLKATATFDRSWLIQRFVPMRLLTRSTTIGLMLLLGQFVLVGSGYACLGRAHGGDGAAHITLSMSVRAAPDEHAGCDAAPRAAHCMLSGFSCTTIGACGVGPMTAVAVSSALDVRLTSQDTVNRAGAAPTRSIAPEPPPPRA